MRHPSKPIAKATSLAVLIAILLGPMTALSQAGRGDWAAVRQLATGTTVEVRTPGSKTKGRLHSVTDTAIELDVKGFVTDIARSDVERVYRLGGKDRGKGAVIGAAIGGGAGVAVGVGIYS